MKMNMGGKNDGPPPMKPALPELPPLRTFVVRRRTVGSASTLEAITVHAHELDFAPNGALVFRRYAIRDGAGFIDLPNGFNEYYDYEEILPTGLIH
jgi:hypothetical protein